MSDDDPPVVSRSPRGTIVVRIKRSAQVTAARVVVGPLVKFAIGGVAAGVAALMAWRC